MIYLELESELMNVSIMNIIVLLICAFIVYNNNKLQTKTKTVEYSAKPVYLRYTKYDPETGNIKYTTN